MSSIISYASDGYSIFKQGLITTGLDVVLRDSPQGEGATVFAPSNSAFEQLGPTINEFLSCDNGLKYLRDLLSYHIIFNHIVYSDIYWNVTMALFDVAYMYHGDSHVRMQFLSYLMFKMLMIRTAQPPNSIEGQIP